jgi:small subunit ribosomal protein S1
MADSDAQDQLKEKFRPLDAQLDKELNDALAGVSLDDLYGMGESAPAKQPAAGEQDRKGPKRGRVVSVDAAKDEVFVDFGGKSQGVAAFSQFDTEPKVGDEMEFHVERYDPREGLLILNRKGAASTNVSWENLEVGQIVEGMVTGVNKGGLELTIKGMRAFMPAGQIDLYFNPDISVFLNQKMQAEVVQFDAHAKNLIVSRRHILERERAEARDKLMQELAEGQVRRGTIRSVMDYGAFVDLGGVDGLLHVSEITHRRGIKPSEFVKVGDNVDVKVIRIDPETGKLSLSLKQMMADPWVGAETKYAVGTPVTGRVSKVLDFGAFIEVEEGVEGLLPASEISWQRVRHPSEVVKEGDTLRLVVINLDPTAKKLSFSLKQAGPDPWRDIEAKYAKDQVVTGTVTRLADFGAFVEIEAGLEGLVHISELANQRIRAPGDVVKPGQQVQVRILDINQEGRRISLSVRRAQEARTEASTAGEAASAGATPAAPVKKKKRPELRGGLDFKY